MPLDFSEHIKTCYVEHAFCALRHVIRHALSAIADCISTHVHWLDYGNAIYADLNFYWTNQFQSVLNAAARGRVIGRIPKF